MAVVSISTATLEVFCLDNLLDTPYLQFIVYKHSIKYSTVYKNWNFIFDAISTS